MNEKPRYVSIDLKYLKPSEASPVLTWLAALGVQLPTSDIHLLLDVVTQELFIDARVHVGGEMPPNMHEWKQG